MISPRFAALAAIVSAGCAGRAPAPVTARSETVQVGTTPAPEKEKPHGAAGAQQPIALPHHVVDGKDGATLDEAGLADRLRTARVIYVGEEHTNPHDHAAQLAVLERAYAVDPSVGIGLEMLPRTLQPVLDRYVRGEIDETAFLAEVDWSKTWGYPWGLYRPLIEFCREHKLRAFALNAPRALTKAVAHEGLEALTPELKKDLPELKPGPAAHRELVREAYGGHPHKRFADHRFERFYAAQLVWDETMADRVAAALSGPGAPKRLVVLAGDGHVRRFAIPDRAARRGAQPYIVVLPVLDRDLEDARKDAIADLYWVMDSH
jgi:uncharacterized iron-regulated protein